MTNLWYQCRLRQGATETIAWIETRGAREGARVEITTEAFGAGLWDVIDVFQPGLEEKTLRQKQAMDRKGMPDILGAPERSW